MSFRCDTRYIGVSSILLLLLQIFVVQKVRIVILCIHKCFACTFLYEKTAVTLTVYFHYRWMHPIIYVYIKNKVQTLYFGSIR